MTTDAAPPKLATWTIDPYHNFAQFTVKHMMIATVTGRLGAISGTLQFDPSDLTTGSVEATIDVTALSTGVDMRDNDLRSPNFFDVEHYPTISFRSTRVEHVEDDQYRVQGSGWDYGSLPTDTGSGVRAPRGAWPVAGVAASRPPLPAPPPRSPTSRL